MKRAFLAAFLSVGLLACGEGYSNGSRAGTITKFSHKGIFCKTWEGELLMGGMRNNTDSKGNVTLSANVWAFSVTDPEIVSQVQAAMDEGRTVVLEYDQWVATPVCSAESQYIVVGVK